MELHAMGDPEHPFKTVQAIEEVENKWDAEDNAYKVVLECGHHCFVTGHSIFNLTGIHCKECHERT